MSERVVNPFDQRGADTLAREVAKLIERRVIDMRSPAADALLNYADGIFYGPAKPAESATEPREEPSVGHYYTHDQLQKQIDEARAQLAAERERTGLLEISLHHKTTLLESAEIALAESQVRAEAAEAEVNALREALENIDALDHQGRAATPQLMRTRRDAALAPREDKP